MKSKTAERLNRFKKPDDWTQRRVEEAFAVYAAAFSQAHKDKTILKENVL